MSFGFSVSEKRTKDSCTHMSSLESAQYRFPAYGSTAIALCCPMLELMNSSTSVASILACMMEGGVSSVQYTCGRGKGDEHMTQAQKSMGVA